MAELDVEALKSVEPRHEPHPSAPADSDARRDAPYRQWVRWAVVGDLAAAAVAAAVARFLRFGGNSHQHIVGSSIQLSFLSIGILVTIVWPLLQAVCGSYDLRALLVGVEELRRLVRAAISLVAFLGFIYFAVNVDLTRSYVASLIPLVALFTGIWRWVLRYRITNQQRLGAGHHNIVAVGPVDDLQRLCVQLLARPSAAIDLVAVVADDADEDTPLTGPLSLIRRLPDRNAIHLLPEEGVPIDMLVRAGRPRDDEMWALARRASELQAVLAIAPHREDASAHVAVSYVPLGSTPLLVVETPTLHPAARAIKAVFDRVVATAMVLVLSPVLLLIAVLVVLMSGRPILYSQERIGRHGRTFRCLKFRTMVTDAEHRLTELLELNEVDGPLFKIRDDPRVTRIGRILRNHSLDELPQLFNVLAGSMSIVGPRPPLPNEVATYNEREARRLLVKPGLTGLWQVEGRSDLPWDEGVYLDLLYVDHWSPLLDMAIIARTIRAVLKPNGAY
jgi:exopolysaccharide biosynthesis polyprenyl glycosylphosphotransferase